MADTCLPPSAFPSLAGTPERRKVRKGTQSCWECKRRKVRCTFAPPRDATCDGCRRRGILCVSQEFPQSITNHAGDRLGRVEALVEQLVKSADTGGTSIIDLPPRRTGDLQDPLRSSMRNSQCPNGTVPTRGVRANVLLPFFHLCT